MRNEPPTFVSTSSATTTRPWPVCLVEHPVDLDRVAPGDDVAVVVAEADLGAVERAGALGAAPGVLEHRLRPQLQRVRTFNSLARGEGPVAGRRLGLGRVEHAEQRRPGGKVDIELAEAPGARAEAQRVLVGASGRALVLVVEIIPEVDRIRDVDRHIGTVARIAADVGGTPEVAVAVVGRGVDGAGDGIVTLPALPSSPHFGTRRAAWLVVRHRTGSSSGSDADSAKVRGESGKISGTRVFARPQHWGDSGSDACGFRRRGLGGRQALYGLIASSPQTWGGKKPRT